MRFLPLLALLAACGGSTPEDSPAPCDGLPPDVEPAVSDVTRVYLNFEGVTVKKSDLTNDPIVGDAKTNTWPYMIAPTTDVAPYREGDPTRDAQIAEIVANVSSFLDPWKFEVITERPADGEYMMVIFGGTGTIVGYGPGTQGTAELDCANEYPHDLAFVFEASDTPIRATNNALFAITQGVGVYPTDMNDNCDCSVSTCTLSETAVCTLSAAATTTSYLCSTGGLQDQLLTMANAVGLD